MDRTSAAPRDAAFSTERTVGTLRGSAKGPTLIVIVALHGNEPAGLRALRRVFPILEAERLVVRGEVTGLAGNLTALGQGERFIDTDLNRRWTACCIAALREQQRRHTRGAAEDRELVELLEDVSIGIESARGELYFLDLHTASGPTPPFATVGDTLRNRRFAFQFGVPVVLGLEEHLDGTFLEYIDGLGHTSMGFESGQHEDPASVDLAESCVWVALDALKLLAADARPRVENARLHLGRACATVPRTLSVRHRHGVQAGHSFRMEPDFISFQPVRRGQLLAHNSNGAIRAPEDGRILMPLYQSLGDDGFFLMREFRRFWLGVSTLLRRMRLDALLPLLPGVRRDRRRPGTLMVDQRVARWFALEVFHLLGYRRRRLEGNQLIVSRRIEKPELHPARVP